MVEDFAFLNTDSFPKEINKAKIKDIFEILQSQERPDLVKEMKTLLKFKMAKKDKRMNVEQKKVNVQSINQVLPTEMLTKILEFLDVKSLCFAKQSCKHWKVIIDELELVKKATSRLSCLLIAGGAKSLKDRDHGVPEAEIIIGDLQTIQLPNLPEKVYHSSMVLCNETVLLCGGLNNELKCLQLDHGTWKEHSRLNEVRVWHSAVTTQKATFLFGGSFSRTTYEYLPKDSTTWVMGKTKIPGYGYDDGCAIAAKSEQEIWLIGGAFCTLNRILSFNVNEHTFKVWHAQLNIGRFGHNCAFIPNSNNIMITGGYGGVYHSDDLDSTEILNTEDGSITMGSSMNFKRTHHGMDFVTINGEDRLAVFGGTNSRDLDCVEVYNTQTKKWEITSIKMKEPKMGFGYLSMKLSLANELLNLSL